MKIIASPYTRLFWNEYQLDPLRSDYNIVFDQTVEGDLDLDRLSQSLHDLVSDFVLLNSHLVSIDDVLYWETNPGISKLKIFENSKDQKDFAENVFDLETGPLYRFGIFRISEKRYDLLIILHHALIDGYSGDFFSLVSNYYNNQHNTVSLDEQAAQITETNQKFIKRVNDVTKHNAKEYWKKALINLPAKNELPYVKQNYEKTNKVGEYRFQLLKCDLPNNLIKNLKTTLFTALCTVWGILIARYTNNNSAHIAYPIGMKEASGFIYGGQINTVILPIRLSNNTTLATLIKQTNRYIKSYKINHEYRYSHLPIDEIISNIEVKSLNVSMAQTNLKDTLFNFNNCHTNNNERYNIDIAGSELLLEYEESKNSINFRVRYQSRLFSQAIIKQISEHYKNFLIEVIQRPQTTKLSEFSLLTQAEYQQIVIEWNRTVKEYPKDKTIYQLFEEQVLKTPINIAVVFEKEQLTYRELNAKANQLARYLQSQTTIKQDTLVAICLDRSIEMIIGILGIMKAGGAYVPIDHEYPAERIKYILTDTQTEIVLTQSHLVERLQKITDVNIIELDSDCYQNLETTDLSIQNRVEDLAYVIYTSGTTGKPKGVLQSHGNVQRLFSATDHQFKFSNKDIWTLYHSYIFDFSVWEIWGALIFGGKLVIPNNETVKDIPAFVELCIKYKISVLNQTPSAFYTFADNLNNVNISELSLRYIIFGGDALNINLLNNWWKVKRKYDLDTKLINMYGITETTVHVTYKEIQEDKKEYSNIGKPISDLTGYVLDVNNKPVPIGVIGELHIGGAGLARGYLNKPELTAGIFIPNPFATKDDIARGHTKLYKTGDLVRWLSDGNLEYIGRNDFQVKIRGYRIEPGEIENALTSIENINQACALVKEKTGNKYLVGYFVSDVEIAKDSILKQLADKLPDYMVPSTLVKLETFPLTINGKLDRKALPDPEFTNKDSYIVPITDIEIKLCNIWQEVLNLEKVGITDDFFRIGGDSIISIRVVSKIKKLGIEISVRDIFMHNTIENLSKVLRYDSLKVSTYHEFGLVDKSSCKKIVNNMNNISDIYPAGYLQKGMILESELSNSGTYHDVFPFQINKQFNYNKIVNIIGALIEKHELLRASFLLSEEYGYLTVINNTVSPHDKICIINDYADINSFLEKTSLIKFDYKIAGLYKFYVLNQTNSSFIFIFSFHHAITDGWSVASLLSEFTDAYVNDLDILKENLPKYGEFIKEEVCSINNEANQRFWINYLLDYEYESLDLKLNSIGENNLNKLNQISSNYALTDKQNKNIFNLAVKYETSVDVIFMSLYQLLLSVFLNKPDITIGIVVNNRLETDGGDKLFGLHLNTIPLRQHIENESLENLILKTRDNKTRVYKYKSYPYGKLKSDLNLSEDIYQCAFNYIHFHIAEDQYKSNSIESLEVFEKTNIPLVLDINRCDRRFSFEFRGDISFIDIKTIEKLKNYMVYYLKHLSIDNPKENVLKRIPEKEYQQIVIEWNKTDKEYPKDKTIYQLFEEQVFKTPNKIALVFHSIGSGQDSEQPFDSAQDKRLTYRELNANANQLARYLKSKATIKPDTFIALCLDRSLEMIVGILGIMKAGGAYVPIDPEYPAERIRYILNDTQTELVLTQSHLVEKLRKITDVKLIALDSDCYQDRETTNLPIQNRATDLAYVIYTSGTTGRPKGIMIEHKSLTNLIFNQILSFNICSERVVLFASYVFDASVEQIFLSILSSSSLFIPSLNTIKDRYLFEQYLLENKITHLDATPSYLDSLVFKHDNTKLKRVVSGAEKFNRNLISKYSGLIFNVYGPTETSITASQLFIKNSDTKISIGTPIANVRYLVLDTKNSPVPHGVIGELHIGGAGLARGYLNKPELTVEKFIPNPFATKEDIAKGYTRLYKTGDMVRWLPDGNLKYIGRNDFQDKIRGYRIELGEIENTLTSIENIKQACVLAKEKNDSKYLVGYFVTENSIDINEDNILNQLSKQLSDYMVPATLVKMETFPLTLNGKLDRKALPDPEFTNEDFYIAPSTDLEIKLCKIWQEVLNLEKVGVTDDFFRIGGESILAIKLSHKISNKLDSHIAVADIFKYKSVSGLAGYLNLNEAENVEIIPLDLDKYPLSFAQQRLWFIEQYEQGTNAYHIPMFVELRENCDKEKLKKTVQQIIQRHEVLRTIFKQVNGEYYQIVVDDKLIINEYNNSELNIWKQIESDINTPFNLEKEFPIRVSFYHKTNRIYLLVNIHHIASDGWSTDILLKEINDSYNDKNLPDLLIQYKDFAHWQREYLQGEVIQNQLSYWQEKLQGYELLILPTDKVRPKQIDYSGDNVFFNIDKELSNKLRNLSKEQGCTMYTTLLSGFYILLSKYTSQDDTVIGTPIANRHYSGIQDLIGFFVNSLALRKKIDQKNTILELISQVQENLIEAQKHQDLPFEKLVEELRVEQDTSKHPIFQVMFGVQSFDGDSKSELFKHVELNSIYTIAKYDLTCFMDDSQDEIQGLFNYATALYEKPTIGRIVNHYLIVLEQMVSDKYKRLQDISLLTQAEYQQIVIDWNKTEKDYPKDKTIYQLFEEQVLKTPNNIAVVFPSTGSGQDSEQPFDSAQDKQLTYRELNAKANQLARYLQSQTTIKPDTLIALCLDRSLEMIIGILGIMKAGGAYVPIDPEYPVERICYILEDTQSELVLTQSHLVGRLREITDVNLIELNSDCYYQNVKTTNLPMQNKPTDLAYVIYTSGTTGKPKGVSVEHTAIVNRVLHMIEFSNISYLDTYIFKTNYVFDVSVSDIFSHMLAGANIIITKYTFSLSELKILLNLEKITSIHLVPSQYDLLVKYINKSNINKIYFSGEKLTKNIIDRIPKNIASYNYYGPTELGEVTSTVSNNKNISSIGSIFPCNKAYILNKSNTLVPQGVIGELHISGVSLARGYLNKPGLTSDNFIPNPFATKEDIRKGYTKLYKTGDLVRWLPDGNLEYIGRNDFQVKIRGYRIELGEIETGLTSIENIKQACALVKEKNSNKYLVGYFVSDVEIAKETILNQLVDKLPDYMVPSVLVKLETFPLTINGKLDRKALPDPEFTNKDSYLAPITDLEIKLCKIWQEVLKLEKVGVKDDFFRIGGESILAIKLSHQISRELDSHIAVADIFKYKSVSSLVDYLNSNETEHIKIIPQNLNQHPLSFAQQRLWFIEQYEQGTNAYHIPMFVELQDNTDQNKLKSAIEQIIQRHEILRTIFKQIDGEYYQIVIDDKLKINEYNNSVVDISKQIEKDINTPFDLQKEFPVRVCFYHKGNTIYLLVNIHHIASDGWSVDILLREINALYNDKELPSLSIQYKDFAYWQREYLQGDILQDQLSYWQENLEGYEALALPTDKARPKQIDYSGDDTLFSINEDLSNKLGELSKELGCSMYTTLLSGFYILLSRYTSQDDIVLGTPIANRHYSEIHDLIGFFVNSLALRENINQENNIVEFISQVQNSLIKAQRHQDLPFEKLVEELNVEQDTSRHPIFQVMFGVQSFGGDSENKLFKFPTLNKTYSIAKYDLTCFMDVSQKKIRGSFNFATALYDKPTILRMVDHYLVVLEQMVSDKHKLLKDISLLSQDEYQQIVVEWNRTDKEYPKDKIICQLFKEQVLKTPDNIAVVFEDKQLTYYELNAKSNQLARYLQSQTTIKPDTLIALCLDRSLEMIIGILGIMKSGGAYVPIDPVYPAERVNYILNDSQTEIVLTQSRFVGRLQKITDVNLIELDSECYQNQQAANLPIQNKSTDLAYVIYTSGTTGKPKGAVVTHKSLNNLVIAQKEKLTINEKTNVLQFASLIFDASVWEIFSSLSLGAVLNIISEDSRKSAELFIAYLIENNINVATIPPVFLSTLEFKELYELKILIVAGEPCPEHLMQQWSKGRTLINAFGPTENTVCATMHEYKDGDLNTNIGKPLNNIACYVLNTHYKPVPVGVVGELFICGTGLARGYLNRPDLTAEKFIEIEGFGKSQRIYKTGDLVRWLPDGNLEFLGRLDHQIKLRGFRIELGEIESNLRQYDAVSEAVVVPYEADDNKCLVAYITTIDSEDVSHYSLTVELCSWLKARLPEYMVPACFTVLDTMPLTPNGKIDRKKIEELDIGYREPEERYVAPRTPEEKLLSAIWAKVLRVERIGIHDNFFELGGHSLQAIQLISKITLLSNINISVRQLFLYPTIAQFAKLLENSDPKCNSIEPSNSTSKLDNNPISAGELILSQSSPYFKLERRSLLSLLSAKKIQPINAAALGYLPNSILEQTDLSREEMLEQWFDNLPVVSSIIDTAWGRIALILLPRLNCELYGDTDDIVDVILDALEIAGQIGASTVSLTGMIPSATDYGRAIAKEMADRHLPQITTGHSTTSAAVVLAIQKVLRIGGREIAKEQVGVIGLGSIGYSSLCLMLKCLPHPVELLLCDLYSNKEFLENIRGKLVRELGFHGKIQLLFSEVKLPDEIYNATLIVGATNVPDVLDISKVKSGTLIVDDSGPHCFKPEVAVKRF